jgi:hypothetical protein
MKTTCLVNFLFLAFVIAYNFEFSDLPYFNDIVRDAYLNSLTFLKLIFKRLSLTSNP